MADRGADPRAAYLSRVAAHLRLHDGRTHEIVEELAAHIADATDSLVEEGLERDRAEREALARLGDPAELGRQLGAANRTTRRLLAGAGGGVWAAARAGVGGLVLGYAAMAILVLGLMVVLSVASQALGREISLLSGDRAWSTVLLGGVLWFALARASRAAVAVASERSARPVPSVRPWVAIAGGVATAITVGWIWTLEHNWASIVIIGTLPCAAIAGALTATGAPPRRVRGSWLLASALAVFVLLPLMLFAAMSAPASVRLEAVETPTYDSIEEAHRAFGYDRIGALIPAEWERGIDEEWATVEVDSDRPSPGWVTLTARDLSALPDATWRDVRLELWAMASPETVAEPRVTGDGALASVPVTLHDGRLRGNLQIDRFPGVTWAGLALTGIGPDGLRYLLVAPQVQQTAFAGTITDWFAALAR
jgi:hypothetical protein